MNEKDILIGQIKDKYRMCQGKNVLTSTDFLDLQEQSIAKDFIQKELAGEGYFFGGYEDAERKKLIFLPGYIRVESEEDIISVLNDYKEIQILRLKRPKEGKTLSHRDYLGSLMAEGIKREKLGDILVTEKGADVIVAGEMAEYLKDNYSMAGRVSLEVSLVDLSQIDKGQIVTREIRDTVPSLRADAVIGSAFGLSRSKALEAIKMGIVYVNSSQIFKADKQIEEGDTLVIRGKGKAKLREIAGKSKKDRTYVIIDRFI